MVAGLCGGWLVLGAAVAVAADPAGWRAARWGMDAAALDRAFGGAIDRLPGRWDYGGAYATRGVLGIDIAGYRFNGFFQMNATTHRLQQVLLEGLRQRASARSHLRVVGHFRRRFGAPAAVCHRPRRIGDPEIVAAVWRFATTIVHVTLLDFSTTAVLHQRSTVDRTDPRTPRYKQQQIRRRTVPRRIVVRFHPSDRRDLDAGLDCVTVRG